MGGVLAAQRHAKTGQLYKPVNMLTPRNYTHIKKCAGGRAQAQGKEAAVARACVRCRTAAAADVPAAVPAASQLLSNLGGA